nr:replication initiator protein A [Peptoniphilus sp. oral taxon 386]
METLGRSNKTAVKILNELDNTSGGIGLIERKKRGFGKPNIIYVRDFMSVFRSECKNYTSEVKNLHSRSVETTSQEMKNVHGSNLNINNTEYSNPDMSLGKVAYGTFQNVFLTEDEVMDLKEILQSLFDNYIERLSTYIQSTGKTYKDHKATILSWFYKDRGSIKQTNKAKSYSLEDYEMGDYL